MTCLLSPKQARSLAKIQAVKDELVTAPALADSVTPPVTPVTRSRNADRQARWRERKRQATASNPDLTDGAPAPRAASGSVSVGKAVGTTDAPTVTLQAALDQLARETRRADDHERAWRTLRSLLNLPAEPVDGGRDVLDAITRLERERDEARERAADLEQQLAEARAGGHRSQPSASSLSGARGGGPSRRAPAGQGKADPADHDPTRCRKLACPCKVGRRA